MHPTWEDPMSLKEVNDLNQLYVCRLNHLFTSIERKKPILKLPALRHVEGSKTKATLYARMKLHREKPISAIHQRTLALYFGSYPHKSSMAGHRPKSPVKSRKTWYTQSCGTHLPLNHDDTKTLLESTIRRNFELAKTVTSNEFWTISNHANSSEQRFTLDARGPKIVSGEWQQSQVEPKSMHEHGFADWNSEHFLLDLHQAIDNPQSKIISIVFDYPWYDHKDITDDEVKPESSFARRFFNKETFVSIIPGFANYRFLHNKGIPLIPFLPSTLFDIYKHRDNFVGLYNIDFVGESKEPNVRLAHERWLSFPRNSHTVDEKAPSSFHHFQTNFQGQKRLFYEYFSCHYQTNLEIMCLWTTYWEPFQEIDFKRIRWMRLTACMSPKEETCVITHPLDQTNYLSDISMTRHRTFPPTEKSSKSAQPSEKPRAQSLLLGGPSTEHIKPGFRFDLLSIIDHAYMVWPCDEKKRPLKVIKNDLYQNNCLRNWEVSRSVNLRDRTELLKTCTFRKNQLWRFAANVAPTVWTCWTEPPFKERSENAMMKEHRINVINNVRHVHYVADWNDWQSLCATMHQDVWSQPFTNICIDDATWHCHSETILDKYCREH